MTSRIRKRLAKLLAVIAIAGVATTWAVGQVRNRQAARSDQIAVARLTDNMQTVCMGRFLVDMPEEARLELARPRIDGFDISPSHPDIEIMTILAAGTKPGKQSLLERRADTEARLSASEKKRMSTLRAARRSISGITGDELATRFTENKGAIVYSFVWELNGTEDDVRRPHLVFELDTGKSSKGSVASSLSQDAAMALWDKISSGIRLHTAEKIGIGTRTGTNAPLRQTAPPPARGI